MAKILFEGQEIKCPDEIKSPEQAVEWFSAIEPSAKGAQVETIVKGGEATYQMEARAHPKGVTAFLDNLKTAKEYVNPAITKALELKSLSQADLVLLDPSKIEKAVADGVKEVNREGALIVKIGSLVPKPGVEIPDGF